MIALLCSVPVECEALHAALRNEESLDVGSRTLLVGSLFGRQVVLCAGGIGKANAAHAASIMITKFFPEALLIFGVGGAYASSGATRGDIAIATKEIAGDEGVQTLEGFRDTEFIGIPLAENKGTKYYNAFPAPEALLTRTQDILSVSSAEVRMHAGTFVTLSTCTGTSARAEELEKRYQGLCENMEGAAAAQIATLHGIPWLEVRGISNLVEDRDRNTWDIPGAARIAQKAVQGILEQWNA